MDKEMSEIIEKVGKIVGKMAMGRDTSHLSQRIKEIKGVEDVFWGSRSGRGKSTDCFYVKVMVKGEWSPYIG